MNSSILTTAQNVNLSYNPASMGSRMGSFILDWIIKIAYIILVSIIISNLPIKDSYFLMSLFFLPVMFFSLIFEVFNQGQTPGKKANNLKVVSADGRPTKISQYILRWLMGVVDFYILSGAIALLSIGSSLKSQRVGDMIANTLVVDLKPRKKLHNTAFVKIPENYQPQYPSAIDLRSEEVQVIKEVLQNRHENSFHLTTETAAKIESILDIRKETNSRDFLRRVISDYNYYQVKEREELGYYTNSGLE